MARNDVELLRLLFEHSPIPQFVSGQDGAVIVANPAYAELVGTTLEEAIGSLPAATTHPDDVEPLANAGRRLLRGDKGLLELELRIIRPDGEERWCAATSTLATSADGERLFVSYLLDITDRRRAREEQQRLEAQLAHEATHDVLTGLPNRALLLDTLERALDRETPATPLAVLFIDLDRLKDANDRLGHDAGDELLVEMARRLSSAVRSGSIVARLGGDEFVVLAQGVGDEAGATALARRILHAVASRPVVIQDVALSVTASVGIALSSGGPEDHAEGLLREADAAMYRAKDRGRARFELFDEGMRHRAAHREGVVDELRTAITAGQLLLLHQPIVDLQTGAVTAVEALVRWQHPERGLLGPDEFLRVAEDSGLIVQLGVDVFDRACRQLVVWREELGDRCPAIHVNLSPREITTPGLVDLLSQIIGRTGVDPRLVCLEITEGALMGDPSAAAATLGRMRALGATVAVDDFGVRHTSLAHLNRFPLDLLKVDRSFVDRLGPDPEDSAIASAVVRLAHTMGLRAVAEGVETVDQLERLRDLKCDAGQGFLFSPPVPGDEIVRLIRGGSLLPQDKAKRERGLFSRRG